MLFVTPPTGEFKFEDGNNDGKDNKVGKGCDGEDDDGKNDENYGAVGNAIVSPKNTCPAGTVAV